MTDTFDLESFLKQADSLKTFQFKDDDEKSRVMQKLRGVSDDLQGTYDKLLEIWGAPTKDVCIRIGVDVGLWTGWVKSGAKRTSKELADMTGVNVDLMDAILKHLAAWHVVSEVAEDVYESTAFSEALARPEIAACIRVHFHFNIPMCNTMPLFLKTLGYKRPNDPKWTAHGFAKHFHGDFFEYMQADKIAGADFDLTMQGYTADRASWLVPYPAMDELMGGTSVDEPILVDVAGGLGQDIEKFHRLDIPGTTGRLILQDLPHIIEKATDLMPGIKKQVHDFWTEQPVKGAKAYFLHSILHDWPDEQARAILVNLKSALHEGYSRILVNDIVLPATNASKASTSFDWLMMGDLSGRERDEKAWRSLIESAGLKVHKIWSSPSAIESVIEVRLP